MENSQNSDLRLQLDLDYLKHIEEYRCYLTKEEITTLYNYIKNQYMDPEVVSIIKKMREIVDGVA